MATILPEGLYNANTYTITWDENEPAFYLIREGGQDIAWLKDVQYFGLGTDTPGDNENKVIVDNWCIREKLKEYQHQYRISDKTYTTNEYETEPIFKKNIARYQVPSYHINGKKMYGTGEANYNGHISKYDFKTRPEGKLYLTENEAVDILNAQNVFKFGWGSVGTNDLEEKFVLDDDVHSIVQAFLAPTNGFFKDVLDQADPYEDPETLSLFGKLSLQRKYCVVKFYERENPNIFGYTALGNKSYFQDSINLTLNNGEVIPVVCYRTDASYPNDAVSLTVGVKAIELSGTYGAATFVNPDETIRFTLGNNSIGAVAVKLIYAGGLDNGVMVQDGKSYDGSIKVSTSRYLKVIITAHCSSTENAWIEIYAKPAAEQGDTRGGWVEMENMIPIIHPNYKKYDFVALPYLNPYDKCNNCKAVLNDNSPGTHTTCPHCGSTNIVKFR